MIAKGELVLAPVQQQDLVFLMQSGTQEWRGEYQAAQMTSLMQLEQELAQGKLFCKNLWTLVVFLEEQPVGVVSVHFVREGLVRLEIQLEAPAKVEDWAAPFCVWCGTTCWKMSRWSGWKLRPMWKTLRHRRCLSAAASTQRVYWDATAFIMDATMTVIYTAI